jgi:DNA-binding NarL/FixJ family response regulator
MASDRIPIYVFAADPVLQAGVASTLRVRPELHVVNDEDIDSAAVAVIVADEIDESTLRVVRAVQRSGCPRVLLLVAQIDDQGVLKAVEAGVAALVRRSEAVPERLVEAVRAAAAGDGSVPPDLLGRLLGQVSLLQRQVLTPRGLRFSGLTDREIDVLRLLADGCDTSEVATTLHYSERTVKNVVQDITRRHNLRNRTHAVAYALRQGLI